MGIELVEWTYDPLQAFNAHLNFAKLGVVVEEYEENIYGESSSLLHRGSPTDRFVAEWHLRTPHVERRISAAGTADAGRFGHVGAGRQPLEAGGPWLEPVEGELASRVRRVLVEIPIGFSDMQANTPDLALRVAHGHPPDLPGLLRPAATGSSISSCRAKRGAGTTCWRSLKLRTQNSELRTRREPRTSNVSPRNRP